MAWFSVEWLTGLAMAYLIGSVPSAYLAGRLLKGTDIRQEGDQNPGAGNAYRSIGPKAGLAVGAADIGKGAVAVLICMGLTRSTSAGMAGGVAVVAGHNWPIFLQLRGGRGAASTVGVFLALMPMPAVALGLLSMALLPVTRSATIAVALIMIPLPLAAWLTGASYSLVIYTVGLPMGVGIRHYFSTRNIHRLERAQAEEHALPQG